MTGAAGEPLLKNVTAREIQPTSFRPLVLPAHATPLFRVGSRVAAAVVETRQGKLVILSFDPEKAGWVVKRSFVVFWANVYDEARKLSGAGGALHYRTGTVLQTPSPLELSRVGIHKVKKTGDAVAANLLAERESTTAPKNDASEAPRWTARTATPSSSRLSPWLFALSACLALAWWHLRR